MAELSFNQTLMEECKKRQEEKDHKELIKSLKPLVSSQPAFNYANIKTVKDSIKHSWVSIHLSSYSNNTTNRREEMDANLFIQTNGTGIRKLLKQKEIKWLIIALK